MGGRSTSIWERLPRPSFALDPRPRLHSLSFYFLAEFSRAILRVEADLKVNVL
ncbi:unnamed protein product, partial [Vitis vinifera]